jgi:hypothetical protein
MKQKKGILNLPMLTPEDLRMVETMLIGKKEYRG